MNMDAELLEQLKRVLTSLEQLLPKPAAPINWGDCLAANWRRHSFAGYLEPISSIDSLHLDDLLGIDRQKVIVEGNTRQFLAGIPANNVLLWGTRGTGKSSLVRALLHTYAAEGLRIVQVDKDDLIHLPDIVDTIKILPEYVRKHNLPYSILDDLDPTSERINELLATTGLGVAGK